MHCSRSGALVRIVLKTSSGTPINRAITCATKNINWHHLHSSPSSNRKSDFHLCNSVEGHITREISKPILITSRNMASLPPEVREKLDKIPDVKIDASGRFKYILIKVFAKDKDGKHLDENAKLVVRGRADCPFHGDIFDKFQEEISALGLAQMEAIDDDILGGGRIERKENKITVFGYSQGYGRADHSLTVEILKRHFPTHEISWNNDGY